VTQTDAALFGSDTTSFALRAARGLTLDAHDWYDLCLSLVSDGVTSKESGGECPW